MKQSILSGMLTALVAMPTLAQAPATDEPSLLTSFNAFTVLMTREMMARQESGELAQLAKTIRSETTIGALRNESRVHVLSYRSLAPEKRIETARYVSLKFYGIRPLGIIEGDAHQRVSAQVILEARSLPGATVDMKVSGEETIRLGTQWRRFAQGTVTASRMDDKPSAPMRIERQNWDPVKRRTRGYDKTTFWFFRFPTDVKFEGTGAGYEVRISMPKMWFPDAQ